MKKILIGGAGGAPTENVIRSLKEDGREEIIGIGSEPFDMALSASDMLYQVPYAGAPGYKERLFEIIAKEKPDFAHFQNDLEIREVSRMRSDILAQGVKLFMPTEEVIETCVDKGRTAEIWMREGITVPRTMIVEDKDVLKDAFDQLGNDEGFIWLRTTVGGGGKGALPTNDYEFACRWIERFNGWGGFTAAELLAKDTVTWLSIWYEGDLVVAQTRKRDSWNFGNRTLSGVTGITRVGVTSSDEVVTSVAQDAINAIDPQPHGIYGVDMTYDSHGFPNPTEINISRFFTTVYFFTAAGLNMPKIFKDIALYGEFPSLEKRINPLPDGLIWVRGMDRLPTLTTIQDLEKKMDLLEMADGNHESC